MSSLDLFRFFAINSLEFSVWRRKHGAKAAFSVLAVLAVTALAPRVIESQSSLDNQIAISTREGQRTEEIRTRDEALKDRAAIANTRLDSGCNVFPTVIGRDGRLAAITEGQRIINPDTGTSFPEGAIACDSYGTTGVVDASGRVVAVAVTTDFNRVRKAMALHGLEMRKGDSGVSAAQGSQVDPQNTLPGGQ